MSKPEYIKDATRYVKNLTSAMEGHIQKRYNLPEFKLTRKNISFAAGRRRSWGGVFLNRRRGPNYGQRMIGYSLALYRYTGSIRFPKHAAYFNEYKHISHDPEIGRLDGVHWKKAVAALVAHEIAHALQMSFSEKVKAKSEYAGFSELQLTRGRKNESHGKLWQFIYRDLRNTFVNNDAWQNIDGTKTYKGKKVRSRKTNGAATKSEKKNVTVYTKTKRVNKDWYVATVLKESYVPHAGYKTAEFQQIRIQDKLHNMKTSAVVNKVVFSDGREIEVKNKWEAKRKIAEYFGMEKI